MLRMKNEDTGVIPGANDVLLRRGRRTTNNEGNRRLQQLIDAKFDRYHDTRSTRTDKHQITQEIVAEIKQSGRFLRQDSLGRWEDADDETARVSVGHAMRYNRRRIERGRRSQSSSPALSPTRSPAPLLSDSEIYRAVGYCEADLERMGVRLAQDGSSSVSSPPSGLSIERVIVHNYDPVSHHNMRHAASNRMSPNASPDKEPFRSEDKTVLDVFGQDILELSDSLLSAQTSSPDDDSRSVKRKSA